MGKEFSLLDQQTVAMLAQKDELYRVYADALMLLQDLMAPCSASRSHQTFNPEVSEKRLNSLIDQAKEYRTISQNIRQNLNAAKAIIAQCDNIKSVVEANAVQVYADEFIDTLAQMYGLLRSERKRHKTAVV